MAHSILRRCILRLCAIVGAIFLMVVALAPAIVAEEQEQQGDRSVLGTFVGTTPATEPIRRLIEIPDGVESLRWQVTLHQDPQTLAPTRYRLRCTYQVAKTNSTITKEGEWRLVKPTAAGEQRTVYELAGAFALAEIDRNVLHILDRDRNLMVGTGGWSYTLNRADAAEKPVDPAVVAGVPDMSYTILPLASGANVFGVFEGRTPYQGIARQLKTGHESGFKAKWRVTLFQDPSTREPTTYRIEGTLFRAGAREGTWKITRGTPADPEAKVLELSETKTQTALHLLVGDEDVLFFLNHERQPLVGHADFSYTLNRRTSPSEPVPGK